VFSVWNITKGLFILCLVLLPFAEWRIFSLALHGRKSGIDWAGYRSASAFDLAYFFFFIFLLPWVWRFIKDRRFISPYMLFWIPAIILVPILYVYLWPDLPYLTPSQNNVIDARSFIIHVSVAVGVTIFLSYIDIERIMRGTYLFYCGAMVSFVILSLLALGESTVFYFNYPFATPFTISFPFPNQNVAAPFISICVLGMIGTAEIYKKKIAVMLAIPAGVMAAALTGSRSNMVLLMTALAGYGSIYAIGWVRGRERDERCKAMEIWGPVVGIGLALGVVWLAYEWQPVRRSLSLFEMLVTHPGRLLWGAGGESPRMEMWSKVLSGEVSQNPEKEERLKSYIVLVENGRVARGGAVEDLRVGEPYYVRLRVRRISREVQASLLEVLNGKPKRLVGKSALVGHAIPLKNLFLFVSDTGTERGLVTISASLDNYRIGGRDKGELVFTFSRDEGLDWYEEWYGETYGDFRGVIRSDRERLDVVAYEKAMKGYVNRPNVLEGNEGAYSLEYELFVHNLEPVFPTSGPARFCVGFHDGSLDSPGARWEEVKNALLVCHERHVKWYEEELLRHQRWLKLKQLGKGGYEFGQQDHVRIENLWELPITKEDIEQAKKYRLGAGIHGKDPISVEPDESWSAEEHLSRKGSTHNVYLDWYYYVGKIPFALFCAFIALLLQTFSVFSWRQRKSKWAPFYHATWFQIVVLIAAMSAHPGIWIKYIWFLFGLAGGMMLSEERHEEGR